MVFQSRTRMQVVLGTLGIVSAMALLTLIRSMKSSAPPPNSSVLSAYGPMAQQTWQKIAPRLAQADREGTRSGEQHLARISVFFAQKRQRTNDFAEDVLGWGGKWAFVQGKLSGDEGKGHHDFLRSAFERHLFTNGDLQQLLQSTVAAYVSELDGQESAALVAIRADLNEQDLPALRSLAAYRSEQAFANAYKKMLAEVIPVVSRDLNVTVGREVAVWVGSEVATSVATRLAISVGILGTGGASSVATFGVSMGVGFAVDYAVDWIMKKNGYDPTGEIARHTAATLQKIEAMLIEGDPGVRNQYEKLRRLEKNDPIPFVRTESGKAAEQLSSAGSLGLRHEINRLRELRSKFREAALKKLLFVGGRG